MRRHLAAGEPAAAIRQYDYLERTLERQLSATTGASARQARRDADNLLRDAIGSGTRLGALLSEFAASSTHRTQRSPTSRRLAPL